MKQTYLILTTVATAILLGCTTGALDKVNPNQVTTADYYKTADDLVKGVNATYAVWQSYALTASEWWFLHDLRSDDVASGGGQLEAPRSQLLIGAQSPNNAVAFAVWNGLFRAIHRANVVIDRGATVTDNPALVKRAIAEATFMRALSYFELVTLWGGVPLYTAYVKDISGTKPKSTAEQVYQQIIADLLAAQTNLPTTYGGADLGRATKGAAQMLLARVYAQRGGQDDYANARTQLQPMIASGVYRLIDTYTDNFTEENGNNPESVFEIGFSKIGDFNWDGDGNDYAANETSSRSQSYNPIGWRNLIPSNALLADFEQTTKGDAKTDPRLAYSFYFTGDVFNNGKDTLRDGQVQGNTSVFNGLTQKVSWRKYTALYKNDQTYYTSGINQRIMRYADALLLMAECENEAGNGPAALALLNQVRARKSVAMPPYPTKNFPVGTKDAITQAIIHERRVELSGEDTRNRDVLRWRKQGKLKTEPLSYFQANKQELLPIPQQELNNNTKLTAADQNPGY